MNRNKRTVFVEAITPVIISLDKEWFPAGKKTPDGEHFYGCGHCDLDCSSHEKHDKDCIVQLGKDVKTEWDRIDASDKGKTNYKGDVNTPETVRWLKDWSKYRAFFTIMLSVVADHFVPIDRKDPENDNVVCTCFLYTKGTDRDKNTHTPDCPYDNVAKALAQLYTA